MKQFITIISILSLLLIFACKASKNNLANENSKVPATTLIKKELPSGIVRAINFSKRPELPEDYFIKNPWVQGVVVRETWSDLEPQEDKMDWSYLDKMIAYGKRVGRPIIFLILTGGTEGEKSIPNTPGWLAGDINGYNRPVMYIDLALGRSNCVTPWDPVINSKWRKTAQKIAGRYDTDSTLAGIYLSGVMARYPEMLIPNTSVFLNPDKLPDEGYKTSVGEPNPALYFPEARLYADTWSNMIDSMTSYFKNTRIILLVDYFNLPGYGKIKYPMESIAKKSDGMKDKVTIGTANLGYNMVIAPPSGTVDEKFNYISAPQRKAPIVYELGPRKQSANGPDGQVYNSLKFAKEKLGCQFVIVWGGTANGTFGIERFENEMKQASKDFWNK